MKSKGIISDGWDYTGFTERKESIVIRYTFNYKIGEKVSAKNSSYTFPKQTVIEELREAKLKQLLN